MLKERFRTLTKGAARLLDFGGTTNVKVRDKLHGKIRYFKVSNKYNENTVLIPVDKIKEELAKRILEEISRDEKKDVEKGK